MSKKELISKWIVYLVKKLNTVNRDFTNYAYNPNPKAYEDLTPSGDANDNEAYSEALRWALNNPEIKNIGITGSYGSGKSSILKTFEKNHREYSFLDISLASFDDKDADDQERKLIEISVLQQIFYRVKVEDVPDSRFNRIKSLKRSWPLKALGWIIWGLSGIFMIKPDFFSRFTWWKSFLLSNNDKALYFAIIVFFLGVLVLMNSVFRILNKTSLNKINVTKGEIELGKNDDDSSILNRYLDEILYFFEVTDYNVVVFEDLDRFNDPKIFTKLRELNILLNNSKQVTQPVVFIYALKDDIFINKDSRTKFFDFIIPIIPIINSYNSGDILLKKLKAAKLNSLNESFLNDVTLYIDDMRMLKNIVNEYSIYKDKIEITLPQDQLFAMIIYKNIYPGDFAKLPDDEGMIYKAFKAKDTYINKIIAEHKQRQEEIEQQIADLEAIAITDVKDLRAIYIEGFIEQYPQANAITIGNASYDFRMLKDDEYFNLFENQANIHYTLSNQYGSHPTRKSFAQLEKYVNTNASYREREKGIRQKNNNQTEKLKRELEKLADIRISVTHWTLQEILTSQGTEILTEDILKAKLIIFLLRNGYINEMYHSFISYFYEGNVTKEDMDFIFSIKNREALPFDFKLSKIEKILKKLTLSEFGRPEILNHNLLTFILDHSVSYGKEYAAFIHLLSDEHKTSLAFIDSYIKTGLNTAAFIKLLVKKWQNMWQFITLNSDYTDTKIEEYLRLIIMYADTVDIIQLNKEFALSEYIEKKENFLSLVPEPEYIDKVQDVIRALDIYFHYLNCDQFNDQLFNFVYENNFYQINSRMIEQLINVESKNKEASLELFNTANYSSVLASGCQHLIKKLEHDLEVYFTDVFLELPENKFESEDHMIEILHSVITNDTKEKIIAKEAAKIGKITDVPVEVWDYLLTYSKLVPTTDNLLHYYKLHNALTNELIDFLNDPSNAAEISKQKLAFMDFDLSAVIEPFAIAVLLGNEIKNDNYRLLVKSIPFTFKELSFGDLSPEKIDTLLNEKILSLSVENYDLLRTQYHAKNIQLLEDNFPVYWLNKQDYSINSNELLGFLRSGKLTISEKISVINWVDPNLIEGAEISDLIIALILKSEIHDFNYELIKMLIGYSDSLINKINLFTYQLYRLDESQVTDILNILNGAYKEIAHKGHGKRYLPNTKYNIELINLLKSIDYISSFKADNDTITIRTKVK